MNEKIDVKEDTALLAKEDKEVKMAFDTTN